MTLDNELHAADLCRARFLYICANPFIYTIKFDPVRRVLAGLILCKKTSASADGGV